MTPEHPDTLTDFSRLKAIQRGSRQAIEDKAIEAYMRAYEEEGKEEAERVFFNHFNSKTYNNVKSIKSQKNN